LICPDRIHYETNFKHKFEPPLTSSEIDNLVKFEIKDEDVFEAVAEAREIAKSLDGLSKWISWDGKNMNVKKLQAMSKEEVEKAGLDRTA